MQKTIFKRFIGSDKWQKLYRRTIAKLGKFEQMIHNDNLQNKDVKNNILEKKNCQKTRHKTLSCERRLCGMTI